ncbi:hypothetical protein BFAG_01880 [Bacteroides fragilis 3_1_12]|uniref:Uncharacterized protein n=1 Tax=Bacteroides fragilis 3_1_12 TaxID=457424 RepID=A0ABN0BJT6_BACFG|nr:hypothetical protein BFAG_01880 [Bacteroides fragilis 3_1_12]
MYVNEMHHSTCNFFQEFLKKDWMLKKITFSVPSDNPGLLFQTFFSIKLCFIILYSWSIT